MRELPGREINTCLKSTEYLIGMIIITDVVPHYYLAPLLSQGVGEIELHGGSQMQNSIVSSVMSVSCRRRRRGHNNGRVVAYGDTCQIDNFILIVVIIVIRSLRGSRLSGTARQLGIATEGASSNGRHGTLVGRFHRND